ncbi:hypothetical protein Tco_0695804 [Tanacetum coccineum]
MAATMKHMAANFSKLDKFEGMDFSRWQKHMHFFLLSINVVYVLSTPILNNGDDVTMEQMRKRSKWKNDDYVCKSLILNGRPDQGIPIIKDLHEGYGGADDFLVKAVSQLEYSRVSGCLMYVMTCTKPDIPFIVGKLILEGYTDASWTSNTEYNSSTSGWVLLLGDGALSWAYKKQSCITSSTMKSEFVALTAAGKEVEWLKNLLLEILLWSKLITPISIHCDSVVTLAKA